MGRDRLVDEMLGATGLAAERDRLAQELEGLLGFLREVADRRLGKRDAAFELLDRMVAVGEGTETA